MDKNLSLNKDLLVNNCNKLFRVNYFTSSMFHIMIIVGVE